ncbi:MAG: hypothetical protein ACYCW6_25025 [Candidatus Xenobia bacterium]
MTDHITTLVVVALIGLAMLSGLRLLAATFPPPMRRGTCPICGHHVSCRPSALAFRCFFCNHAISLQRAAGLVTS